MIDRTRFLAIVEAARSITEGLRPNQLTIRKRTWSGRYPGDGTATDVDLVLPQHYKFRNIEMSEVTTSGGRYQLNDMVVDGITPSDGAGTGYTVDQLVPPCPTPNVEAIYVVTGDQAGEYTLIGLYSVRPFRHTLVLRRMATQP